MDTLLIFTDGSVNTQSKVGYGAYLAVSDKGCSLDLFKSQIKVKRFENTSSTKLELQTLLWALSDIQTAGKRVIIYTDSQNIVNLQKRRERLEKNDYLSKRNIRLKNYKLYQEFYTKTDQMNCEFIRVCGHQVSNQKDDIDNLFTLVDRASRKALREDTQGSV